MAKAAKQRQRRKHRTTLHAVLHKSRSGPVADVAPARGMMRMIGHLWRRRAG
jgi:hypothetical protein